MNKIEGFFLKALLRTSSSQLIKIYPLNFVISEDLGSRPRGI